MNVGINPKTAAKHDKFVDSYVTDFNGLRAAKEAGFSKKTAGASATRLLKIVQVQDKIKAKVEALTKEAEIDQRWVLEKYKRIAQANIKDYIDPETFAIKSLDELTEEQTYAIKKIKPLKDGGFELELENKFPAIHDLGLYTKILDGEAQGDKTLIINQTINYEGLSEEIIKKYGYNKGSEESICNTESPGKT